MIRNLRSTLLAVAVGAGMLLAAGTASATVIVAPNSAWYRFQFQAVGSFATGGPANLPIVQAPGAPPWTFNLASATTLSVTDAFLSGDIFDIFDFGGLILSTSVVGTGGDCGSLPDPCFADPLISSGTVGLPPGAHSLTIQVTTSPFGGGAGYFRVATTVPEPVTLTLFAVGLVGMGFMMRRRRKTV